MYMSLWRENVADTDFDMVLKDSDLALKVSLLQLDFSIQCTLDLLKFVIAGRIAFHVLICTFSFV